MGKGINGINGDWVAVDGHLSLTIYGHWGYLCIEGRPQGAGGFGGGIRAPRRHLQCGGLGLTVRNSAVGLGLKVGYSAMGLGLTVGYSAPW